MHRSEVSRFRLRDGAFVSVRRVFNNWYGYVNNIRVEVFTGDEKEQKADAFTWLALEAI